MIKYDEIKNIIKIIEECSAVALTFYKQKHLEVSMKDDNSPVTKADLEISRIAINKLSKIYPNDKIISEENITDLNQVDMTKYWLIDPIDGTTNFLHGIPHFCISIAFVSNNEILSGVIFDPIKNEVFFAEKNAGSFFNNQRIRVSSKQNALSQRIREIQLVTLFSLICVKT